jgi:integrase
VIRKSLSPNLTVAKKMLVDLRLSQHRRSQGDIDNEYDLRTLFQEWILSITQVRAPSTVKRYEQNLAQVFRILTINNVSQLSAIVIERFRDKRLSETNGKGIAVLPQTINKDLGALNTMLNWAVKRKLIGCNPINGLPKLPESPKESRALEANESEDLLAHSRLHWRRIWYGYLTTGLRKMELASLLFTDVDWRRRELIIRASSAKNKTERRIPIDEKLFEIIERQFEESKSREPGEWSDRKTTSRIQELFTKNHVFVTTANTPLGGNVYREFMSSCKKATIETKTEDAKGNTVETVSLHSTRHTFATSLIANGADPRSVQYMLGHRTLDMTMKVYAKVFATQKHNAISKLSFGSGMTFRNDEK